MLAVQVTQHWVLHELRLRLVLARLVSYLPRGSGDSARVGMEHVSMYLDPRAGVNMQPF